MKAIQYNLALLISNLLFALNYSVFVGVLGAEGFTVGVVYILQCFGLLAIASIMRLTTRARSPIRAIDIAALGATALLSSLGWSYGMLWGLSLTAPIDAATIASVGPSLTLIFAHALGRRRLSGVRVVGIVLSLAGVAMLIFSQRTALLTARGSYGNLILCCAVTIAALNTLMLKPQLERYGLRRVAFIYALFAVGGSLPIFMHELAQIHLAQIRSAGLFEVGALIVAGAAIPMILLFEGTEHLTPLHTSLYRYLQPLTTAAVIAIRGEGSFTLLGSAALVLIVAGGVAVAKGVDRVG